MKPKQKTRKRTAASFLTAVFLSPLFLCIPVMAGGYTGTAPLKINIIRLQEWQKETVVIEESLPFSQEDETDEPATTSNAKRATDSDAEKASQTVSQTTQKKDFVSSMDEPEKSAFSQPYSPATSADAKKIGSLP